MAADALVVADKVDLRIFIAFLGFKYCDAGS